MDPMHEDHDRCYRAVSSRDARFDGRFVTAVTTTGIYCRPSCPAQTPKRENVAVLPVRGGGRRRRFPGLQADAGRRPPRGPASGTLRATWRRGRCGRSPPAPIDGPRAACRARRVPARQRASPAPGARRGGRGRPTRAGPHPARPDRSAAAGRHRPADVTRSPSRPDSRACDSSTTRCASTSAWHHGTLRRGPSTETGQHRGADAAARAPVAVRRRTSARLAAAAPGRRASRSSTTTTYRRVLPSGSVVVAARSGRATSPDDRHRRRPHAARHGHPLSPAARRRRRPDRGRRHAGRGSALAPLVRRDPGYGCPARSTDSSCWCAPCSRSRCRSRRRTRSPRRLVEAYGKPLDSPDGSLTARFPTAETLAERRYDGIGLTGCADQDRCGRWQARMPPASCRSTRPPTATTPAPGCSRCPASGRGPWTTSRCGRWRPGRVSRHRPGAAAP